jgi:hypothetical protein
MRLVRQGGNQIGHADITDVGNAEESESATGDHDKEVEPAASSSIMAPAVPQTTEEMVELLKAEHEICLECLNFWDANAIQNLILEFLQVVRDGTTEIILLSRCKTRMFEVFTELGSPAMRGSRTNPAQRYNRISSMYPPQVHAMFFFESVLTVTMTVNLLD